MSQTAYLIHTPVLLRAVLDILRPEKGQSYLDVTSGYGGHAQAVFAVTKAEDSSVLVDRDRRAIEALQPLGEQGARLIHGDFYSASKELLKNNESFDMILADLGVSSLHLDEAERGFSFAKEGPLDMRMDQRCNLSAAEVVNEYSESELAELIRKYGEEPFARRIAAKIVASRPIGTTSELAQIIRSTVKGHNKIHPATRTFQAIRIAVNNELGQLEKSIGLWLKLLKPGGKLAIISFHSLEDRIVKQKLAEVSGPGYDAEFLSLTKQPVVADDAELAINPRSRSAKLRAVAKINNQK